MRALLVLDRFVRWLFGPRAPFVDLFLGVLAGGWGILMITRPALFDGGGPASYGAVTWLPDPVWIAFYVLAAAAHALGLVRLRWDTMRAVTCLLSGFLWLSLATSFLIRSGPTPGVVVYGQLGLLSVLLSLHIAWHGRDASLTAGPDAG